MMQVTIEKPESMNLLGLILQSIVERNLQHEVLAARAKTLQGEVGVQAGEMQITLSCQGSGFVIRRGLTASARAVVKGSLESFLDIALGGGLVGPVLKGKITFKGNPLFLLKLLPLLRTRAPEAQRAI